MPWETVAAREQKQQFIQDYLAGYCSVSELAERFGISRKTTHKWIARFRADGRGVGRQRPAACLLSTGH